MRWGRRLGVFLGAGALLPIVLYAAMPAGAAKSPTDGNLYPSIGYTAPAAGANVMGINTPTLDLTGATIGFDGTFLRLTAKLAAASQNPPLPFQDQEYYWRFKYDKTDVVLQYDRWATWQLSLNFNPYSVGVTVAGTDTYAVPLCTSCYGTVNIDRGQAEFAITLDDLNSLVGSVALGATPVLRGTALHLKEVDVNAGFPQAVSFPADVATAPKNFPAYTVPQH